MRISDPEGFGLSERRMIIGIDLGTTNSLASVWRDGGIELIPNALGSMLTPSAVSLGKDGVTLVGQAARDRLSNLQDRSCAIFCCCWL